MRSGTMRAKITADHLERTALVYVRQSTPGQVRDHTESRRRQYDRLADYVRRFNARLEDFLPIRRVVAAVNAAPREVDDDVCAVDLAPPVTERGAVPLDNAPWSNVRATAEHHDIMAIA